jgi:hypothetical protein
LPAIPYDTDEVILTVATPHARVRFDTNRYSVPPQYARRQVILRADDGSHPVLRLLAASEDAKWPTDRRVFNLVPRSDEAQGIARWQAR